MLILHRSWKLQPFNSICILYWHLVHSVCKNSNYSVSREKSAVEMYTHTVGHSDESLLIRAVVTLLPQEVQHWNWSKLSWQCRIDTKTKLLGCCSPSCRDNVIFTYLAFNLLKKKKKSLTLYVFPLGLYKCRCQIHQFIHFTPGTLSDITRVGLNSKPSTSPRKL